MNRAGIALGLFAAVSLHASTLKGTEACIHDPITVNAVQGKVYFEAGGKRGPLPNVTLRVTRRGDQQQVVAAAITGRDGSFSLPVSRGRYYLTVEHPAVVGLGVEMKVRRLKSHRVEESIEVVLRNDPSNPCWGATAAVVQRTRSDGGSAENQESERLSDIDLPYGNRNQVQLPSKAGVAGEVAGVESGEPPVLP